MSQRPDERKQPPRPESDAEDSIDQLLVDAADALDPATSAASLHRNDRGTLSSQQSGLELAEGTLVAGRYQLNHRLGVGGMGEVWAATHTITRRSVAMKFLKGAASHRSDARQRFLREARAVSLVQHPSVVEVLDVFELEGGVPVMVMDLLIGETLGAKLAREKVLAVGPALALVLPAVEAVEAAHARGIVHRDLKPDNIFLETGAAGNVVVKVLDFGIAKLTAKEGDAAETGSLTGTGSVLGTPWYMAPEQCCGEDDIDQRADVWALGVILYECLSGRRPVEGSNAGQLVKQMHRDGIVPIEVRVPALAPELARLVGRMLSLERADRPRDLVEVRELLAGLVRSSASETPPSPAAPDPAPARHAVPDSPRASRSFSVWRASAAAAALVVVAVIVWSVLNSRAHGTSAGGAAGTPALLTTDLAPNGASPVAVAVSAPSVGETAARAADNLAPFATIAPQPPARPGSSSTATRVRVTTSPRPNDQAALRRSPRSGRGGGANQGRIARRHRHHRACRAATTRASRPVREVAVLSASNHGVQGVHQPAGPPPMFLYVFSAHLASPWSTQALAASQG